jgi:ribosome assembly protein YihI (activator of Der GTPase)
MKIFLLKLFRWIPSIRRRLDDIEQDRRIDELLAKMRRPSPIVQEEEAYVDEVYYPAETMGQPFLRTKQ